MLSEWIAEGIDLTKMRVALIKMQLSGHSRQQFRRGYEAGYRTGREHQRDGLPEQTATYRATPHPQVEAHGIEVDAGMRDLLVALWRLGLRTQFSCEGHPREFVPHTGFGHDYATQIVFGTLDDASRFVKKTLELVDSEHTYPEGGLHLHTMLPIDEGPVRAEVRFSPALLPAITAAWETFETTLTSTPEH